MEKSSSSSESEPQLSSGNDDDYCHYNSDFSYDTNNFSSDTCDSDEL